MNKEFLYNQRFKNLNMNKRMPRQTNLAVLFVEKEKYCIIRSLSSDDYGNNKNIA